MVGRLVRQYIDELLGEASAIASIQRVSPDSGCLLYAVRHDRLKFESARLLLEMKEVIEKPAEEGRRGFCRADTRQATTSRTR